MMCSVDFKFDMMSQADMKTHVEILDPWSFIRSSITESDVSLIRQRFYIPDEYQIIVPGPNGRIDKPPDGCVTFHVAALEAGLRFPLSRPVEAILSGLNVCPAQLMPNSYRYILGFVILMRYFKADPSVVHFRNLISKRCAFKTGEDGFFFLSPKHRRKLLCNLPSLLGRWKNKFIYVKPPGNRPWRVPVRWNVTRWEPYFPESPSWGHDFVVNRLTLKFYDSSKILMEHVLALADLSPAPIQTTQSLEMVVRASIVEKVTRVPFLTWSQPIVQEPFAWKRARVDEDLSGENMLLRKRVEELEMNSVNVKMDLINAGRAAGRRDFVGSDEYRCAMKRALEEGVRDFVKSNTYAALMAKREAMYKFYGFENCRTLAAKLGAFRKEFDIRQLDPFKSGDLEDQGEAGPGEEDEFAYVL